MLATLALLTSAVLAQTQSSPPPPVEEKLPFVTALHSENDVLVQSDRYYTNGFRLEHYGEYDACRRLAIALGFLDEVEHRYPCGGSLAQNIYTPSRIVPSEGEEPWPDPNDRPYGGWLHAGFLFQHLYTGSSPTASSRLTLQATVGVTGPPSLAGPTQRTVHEALNNIAGREVAKIPVGWEAQLPFEPAVHFSVLRERPVLWSRYVDATWSAGAMLGTVFVNASVGGTVRAGALARPFGLSPIMPSIRRAKAAEAPGAEPSAMEAPAVEQPRADTDSERTWEAYFFARGQARLVARNLFLDGALFRRSISVRKTPFVGDSEFGAAMRTRKFQLDLSVVFRSQELAEPPNTRLSGHRFGQLQLTYLH
jgi:lipid A 3-O-deacylase